MQRKPYASDPSKSKGRQIEEKENKGDLRNVFHHDRDRIIHSVSFRRLKHKTQVFVYHEGDHFRTRLTHSLEVAQIARGIASQLGLDVDLTEAIALAHDLGHTPFGHAGEDALKEAMAEVGSFDHNEQAIRILTKLEHCYFKFDGLNLTWEVLEGIAKHNGPIAKIARLPSITALDREIGLNLDSHASAEAQAAALADDIAYIAHDSDDGIRAGLIKPSDMLGVPLAGDVLGRFEEKETELDNLETSRLVHELTRRIISMAVIDLVAESNRRIEKHNPQDAFDVRKAGEPLIEFSEPMRDSIEELRTFLSDKVWNHYKVNRMSSKGKKVVKELYELFTKQPETLPTEWQFCDGKQVADLSADEKARHIADYIAGMTDSYAMLEHRRNFELGPIL